MFNPRQQLEQSGHFAIVNGYLLRASGLAAEVGGGAGNPLFRSVMDAAADVLRSRLQESDHSWTLPLFDLLIERRHGGLSEWSRLAKAEADRLIDEGDDHGALSFLERVVRTHQINGDEPSRQAESGAMSEVYVRLAEHAPMQMSAATFMTRAIEHLRAVPGTEERREELHVRLREIQRESVNEYGRIGTSLDFGDAPEHAAQAVSGVSPLEAVLLLGLGVSPINVDELRQASIQSARMNPSSVLIPTVATDETGRVVGTSPSALHDSGGALDAAMIRDAQFHRAYTIGEHIEPIRRQVLTEQASHIGSGFESVVRQSWFVPRGRLRAFYKGLLAGLRGDYITATNILIPQVEHAVRHILEQKGVVTSGLNTDRRQNEYALTVTLYEPYAEHLEEVLGPDAVYDLRALLVEPLGPNLRNTAMHGLLDDDAFLSRSNIYCWWLTLWLCCQAYTGPLPSGFERRGEGDSTESD